jgi:peroxin-19
MKETENNEEMKEALVSVVNEIIKKDTLYDPMKTLKDAYPKWLEDNWDKVSHDDLERYNKQLEKIEEICNYYEKSENNADQTKVFEMLS